MSFEVRCVGSVAGTNLQGVLHILRGVSIRKDNEQIAFHEIVLKAPLQNGTASTDIRIIQIKTKEPPRRSPVHIPTEERWVVRHEGINLRGQANDLPASVREVAESPCTGTNVKEFWQALGARVEYEFERTGNRYVCVQDNYELQVFLFELKAKTTQKTSCFLLEAYIMVEDKEQIASAARALAAFSQKLVPFVEMKRAESR